MKFLFCCEYYWPSVGGVQEVMRQIAERLVERGHQVTVATTAIKDRSFTSFNGVEIQEFSISGNLVDGMEGEVERYREFVRTFPCDALLIKAAQQWTFDALWRELDYINARKVFIPCGFLSFYQPEYREYFESLPQILRKFDSLIFYSNDYRDINFARNHKIPGCVVLSNGASEREFLIPVDSNFRKRHRIPEDHFLILLIGGLTGAKGHLELAQAVSLMPECKVTLLLNGNNPYLKKHIKSETQKNSDGLAVIRRTVKKIEFQMKVLFKLMKFLAINLLNPSTFFLKIKNKRMEVITSRLTPYDRVREVLSKIEKNSKTKQVILLDLPRSELIQAYFAADLFVFPSHVEYSPLVLFESAAAGTPFLTSQAGNAKEIIEWLGGGFVMQDGLDAEGFRVIDPQTLADEIVVLMGQKPQLMATGLHLRKSWESSFTWDLITNKYEAVLMGVEH